MSLLLSLRKYANICRASLVERLAYRGDFLLGTFLRFLPVLTTVLLWEAVFKGSEKETIGGFDRRSMIAYLLLIHISRMFSSMPGLSSGISRDIRDGSLKKYLVQPLDLLGYLLAYRVAHKAAYIVTSALPYAILFWLTRDYFDGIPPWHVLLAYVLALLMAFLVGFFFEAMIGVAGFWFLEVSSLVWIVTTINYMISGQMFPLDVMEEKYPTLGWLLKALPFQYLAYFPAMVFLNRVPEGQLWRGLLLQAAWVAVFAVAARLLYRAGLRRYSAYGG
ncbi:MAG: ABC-2 family transporter protein [Gemmataceae bacterium]|nr:ABC-2 family transporter protein [Gemmataceae bacterium]